MSRFSLNKRNKVKDEVVGAGNATMGMPQEAMDKQAEHDKIVADNETKEVLKKAQESRDSYQNFGDKQAEINELNNDDSPEAQARIGTLKSQQNEIVNNLNEDQKQDLQNDIDNGNIPNGGTVIEPVNTDSTPATPPNDNTTSSSEPVKQEEIKETAKTSAAQRFAQATGMDENTAQAYLDSFIKGKMPPGSKGYFIGNAIATAAQNIANQMAANEYNSRWSTIQSGQYMKPEFQKSAIQEYKENNLNALRDIQSEQARENMTAKGRAEASMSTDEAIMKHIDALGYQDKQDLEMQMKQAGLTQQQLQNEILNFNRMNEAERSKWYTKMAEMDYKQAVATLNAMKYGGANLSVKVPGVQGSVDLATVANLGGDLKGILQKAGVK